MRSLQLNPVWNARLRSLSAAKHRFDTWQKPFARLCLTFEAVVSTAQEMHEERRAEAIGRHAKAFLKLVSEDMMICLAMMSDAGEENLALVRFLDTEQMNTMDMSAECARFLERITVLFDHSGCLLTGYTGFMLELLKKERLLFIDHIPHKVGGKSARMMEDIVQRCLQRLRNWTALAREVLAAEFPRFESIQAFSVLRLVPCNERRARINAEDERAGLTGQLQKLANLLCLDCNALTDQFFDHLPVAQHEFDRLGTSAFAAWREALEKVRCGPRADKKARFHPYGELLQVLIRAGSWGASTSGVEQLFSVARAAQTLQRAALAEEHIRDEFFLLTTKGQSEAADLELAEAAVRLWALVYGGVRASCTAGRRCGDRRQHRGRAGTLRLWHTKRRAEVDGLVSAARGAGRLHTGGCAPVHVDPAGPAPPGWTDQHTKEVQFQRQKRRCRALDALREGALLPAEQRAEFGSEAGASAAQITATAADEERMRAYLRAHGRTVALRKKPAPLCLSNKRVYIDRKTVASLPGTRLDDRLAELQATAEPVRERADTFVLQDLTAPGQRVLWNVMLAGGTLVSLPYLLTGTGPVLSYKRAVSTRRSVWISEAFHLAHPTLVNIMIIRLAAGPPVRWKIMASREEFVAAAARNRAAARSTWAFLAFVCASQMGDADLAPAKRVAADTATAFLAELERERCAAGMCCR